MSKRTTNQILAKYNKPDYIPLEDAAVELNISERHVRELCDDYKWFGTKVGRKPGSPWVLTRTEVDAMKAMERRGKGRPKKEKKEE